MRIQAARRGHELRQELNYFCSHASISQHTETPLDLLTIAELLSDASDALVRGTSRYRENAVWFAERVQSIKSRTFIHTGPAAAQLLPSLRMKAEQPRTNGARVFATFARLRIRQ
jgi:hypothetical protein